MSLQRVAVVAFVAVLSLSGCAAKPSPPASHSVTFSEVIGGDEAGYWKPTSATGTSDEFGNILKFSVTVSNENGTYVFATATITYPDGSTMVCSDDDPRHYFALVKTTTSGELPCPDEFPKSAKGATVTITEEQ